MNRISNIPAAGQPTIGAIPGQRPTPAADALRMQRVAAGDRDRDARRRAQASVAEIVLNRPDLADAALTIIIAENATAHGDSDVRHAAQRTMGIIAEMRPDLAKDAIGVVESAAIKPDRDIRFAVVQTVEVIGRRLPDEWKRLYGEKLKYIGMIAARRRDMTAAVAGAGDGSQGLINHVESAGFHAWLALRR